MAVTKVNGFAAPYRSLTFQDTAHGLAQRSGVLEISGTVDTVIGNVVVPPLKFVQNGLVVSEDATRTIALPTDLTAPYFLIVHAPTARAIDDLIYSFAKSPEDLSSGSVAVAHWDGVEWKTLPLVSLNQILAARRQDKRLMRGQEGIQSGLKAAFDGGTVDVLPGVLTDRTGELVQFAETHSFALIEQDVDYARTDRIVYRRAVDSVNRVGRLKYLVGDTYGAGTPIKPQTFGAPAIPPRQIKTLIAEDNSALLLYSEGYGDEFSIYLRTVSSDRVMLSAPTLVVSDATEASFDALLDSDGNIQLVYTKAGTAQLTTLDSAGASLIAAQDITVVAFPASAPQISKDDNDLLYVVFQGLAGPSNNQLFLTTRTKTGLLVTSPVRINNDAGNYVNPSIFVSGDYRVYLAYENLADGKVYYEIRSQFGSVYQAPVYLSGDTDGPGGTLIDGASRAKVVVNDKQEVFVLFLQADGALNLLALWSGVTEDVVNVIYDPVNSFSDYSVSSGDFEGSLQISIAANAGGASAYSVLRDGELTGTIALSASACNFISSARDRNGSMYHASGYFQTGTYSIYETAQLLSYVGPTTVTGTQGQVGVNADQFLMSSTRPEPRVGDRLTLSSSPSNDGDYLVTAVQTASVNGIDDFWLVTVGVSFAAAESPVLSTVADYASPVGAVMESVKTQCGTNQAAAYSTEVPDTDILIARINDDALMNALVGEVVNSDRYGIVAGTVVDWSKTIVDSFTLQGSLKIWDLVNNLEYTLAAASFDMAEGEALIARLDGETFAPTPLVVAIENIPHGDEYVVLGFRKSNLFNPVFLTKGNVQPLSPGEQDTTGQDLPQNQRDRLGILSETTFSPYGSINYVSEVHNHAEAIGALDAALKTEETDRIAADDALTTALGNEASTRAAADQVLQDNIDAETLRATTAENAETLRATNAETALAAADTAHRAYTGSTGVADTAPDFGSATGSPIANTVVVDGDALNKAIKKLDIASNEGCRLLALPASTRVRVTGSYNTLADGTITSRPLSSLEVNFAGAQIDFETGVVYEADGITPLGIDFAPMVIPDGEYAWYSLALITNVVNAVNEMTLQVFVQSGSSTGATAALAPKPNYVSGAINLGMVSVLGTPTGIADIAQSDIHLLVGSGSGSGDGGEAGAALAPADGFKAIVSDTFDLLPAEADSKVDSTLTKATHSFIKEMFELALDKSKTLTTVGTSYTLSAAPTFTVAVGDILWSNAQAIFRRVASVLSPTTGTLDVAFPIDLTAAAGMVSQAVWTKDLVNIGDAAESTRLRDFFPATTIESIHVEYTDSLASGDDVGDLISPARIVVSASSEGLQAATGTPTSDNFTAIHTRVQAPETSLDYPLAIQGERLFLVFFPNPNEAAVTTQANLLDYDVSVYAKAFVLNGGYLDSAFCMSDSTGTPNNCSNPVVVLSKSQVTLNFNFVPDLNSGKAAGDLHVLVEGQTIPRWFTGVTGAYYKEVVGSTTTIEFWANLSGLSLSIQIERRQGSIDSYDQNRLRLLAAYDAVIGSPADVTSGKATHSSLQAAHDALGSSGGRILFPQVTVTENFAWSNADVMIEGKGAKSILAGNLTMTSVRNVATYFRVNGDIHLGASDDSFVKLFKNVAGTFTAGGAGNDEAIIEVT